MHDKSYLLSLLDYSDWANEEFFKIIREIPADEITKQRESFMNSFRNSVNHLLVIDKVWMSHMKKEKHSFEHLQTILFEDLDDLWDAKKEMNKEIAKVIIDGQGQLISKSGTLTSEQNRRIRTIETQGNAGIDTIIYQEQRKLKQATREVKRKRRNDIGASQSQIKNLAVFLPPIPLLIVAFIVFARKRRREMEGAATSRIRGE